MSESPAHGGNSTGGLVVLVATFYLRERKLPGDDALYNRVIKPHQLRAVNPWFWGAVLIVIVIWIVTGGDT